MSTNVIKSVNVFNILVRKLLSINKAIPDFKKNTLRQYVTAGVGILNIFTIIQKVFTLTVFALA